MVSLALAHMTGAVHAHGDTAAAVAGVLLVALVVLVPRIFRTIIR